MFKSCNQNNQICAFLVYIARYLCMTYRKKSTRQNKCEWIKSWWCKLQNFIHRYVRVNDGVDNTSVRLRNAASAECVCSLEHLMDYEDCQTMWTRIKCCTHAISADDFKYNKTNVWRKASKRSRNISLHMKKKKYI